MKVSTNSARVMLAATALMLVLGGCNRSADTGTAAGGSGTSGSTAAGGGGTTGAGTSGTSGSTGSTGTGTSK
jgi:hypothetical protein